MMKKPKLFKVAVERVVKAELVVYAATAEAAIKYVKGTKEWHDDAAFDDAEPTGKYHVGDCDEILTPADCPIDTECLVYGASSGDEFDPSEILYWEPFPRTDDDQKLDAWSERRQENKEKFKREQLKGKYGGRT